MFTIQSFGLPGQYWSCSANHCPELLQDFCPVVLLDGDVCNIVEQMCW